MKKSSKSKMPAIPRVDPYLEGLIAKLVERLVGLERKVDTVIAQTASRSASAGDPAKPSIQAQPPRRERTMYEAICADCSKVCEVPFKPTEARPVYCKDCWGRRKGGGAGNSPNGMPVLTPVALPPKPASKPVSFQTTAPATAPVSGKAKKAKKAKKRK